MNKQQLANKIWASANKMRSKIEANEYNDFSVANVRDALSAFNRLIYPSHKKVFEGIFETLQDGLKKLGGTEGEQTKAVRNLLDLIKVYFQLLCFSFHFRLSQSVIKTYIAVPRL